MLCYVIDEISQFFAKIHCLECGWIL